MTSLKVNWYFPDYSDRCRFEQACHNSQRISICEYSLSPACLLSNNNMLAPRVKMVFTPSIISPDTNFPGLLTNFRIFICIDGIVAFQFDHCSCCHGQGRGRGMGRTLVCENNRVQYLSLLQLSTLLLDFIILFSYLLFT